MLRFIASIASSERGLGIVCAVVTVLGLVGVPRIISASVLRALDNFFLAFAFVAERLRYRHRRRHPASGTARERCSVL